MTKMYELNWCGAGLMVDTNEQSGEAQNTTERWPRVVIVGGGFGGLYAAKQLANRKLSVTLIDRTNHHLFQLLLYQVATAGLSPGDIAQPIRHILKYAGNTRVPTRTKAAWPLSDDTKTSPISILLNSAVISLGLGGYSFTSYFSLA